MKLICSTILTTLTLYSMTQAQTPSAPKAAIKPKELITNGTNGSTIITTSTNARIPR